MKQKLEKKKIKIILGIVLILLSISIPLTTNYKEIKEEKKETINIINYIKINKTKQVTNQKKLNYLAIIHIPKINLKRGLPYPYSKENNVNQNIEILKPFQTPEDKNKNIILASHSGTSNVSFFKNIKDLTKNDDIFIYYKNKKYHYKVVKKYEIKKTGKISITNIHNQTLLTLITCSTTKNKQLVIISSQIRKQNY